MPIYPLLEMHAAFQDGAHHFREVAVALADMVMHPECQSLPPAAVTLALDNINTLLELAAIAFPPALVEAIASEQAAYEEDERTREA